MASLFPKLLLDAAKKADVIGWLQGLPIPPNARKQMFLAWGEEVNVKLTAEDFVKAKAEENAEAGQK